MKIDTIAKQLLFTTVRIETVDATGGKGSGTGFLYNIYNGEQAAPLIVTNKHVVEGASQGSFGFTRNVGGEPDLTDYRKLAFSNFEAEWVGHPDPDIDVAVMPFGPVQNNLEQGGFVPFYRMVKPDQCPSAELLEDLDAVEDVLFIGYPNGLEDEVNHAPIVRRGTTATMIGRDFNGKPQFLLDASVFPGSSGSPVFVLQEGFYKRKDTMTLGTRWAFLGIVAAVHMQYSLGDIVMTATSPKALFGQAMDLGIVYKWNAIEETINEFCRIRGVSRELIPEVESVTEPEIAEA